MVLRILKWGDYPGLSEWVLSNPRVLIRGSQSQSGKRPDNKSRSWIMWSQKPRGAGFFRSCRDKEIDSPLRPLEGMELDRHLGFSTETNFGLLTSRTLI